MPSDPPVITIFIGGMLTILNWVVCGIVLPTLLKFTPLTPTPKKWCSHDANDRHASSGINWPCEAGTSFPNPLSAVCAWPSCCNPTKSVAAHQLQ